MIWMYLVGTPVYLGVFRLRKVLYDSLVFPKASLSANFSPDQEDDKQICKSNKICTQE